jgi:metallo-beta-lactamase class B
MEPDIDVVESGGKTDFYYDDPGNAYPSTTVDRVLRDGDEVKLGDAVLVAHLTPGHTKGCTTYTMRVQEAGKTYNVVIAGSLSVNPTYHLLGKPSYPGIVADYERAFRVMKSMPADIWVAPHGDVFDMEAKYARLQQQGATNPFVDPAGYTAFIAKAERTFRSQLAKEQAALQK